VADRIQGHDLGADDYILKPFHINELLARLRAIVRRCISRPRASDDRRVCPGRRAGMRARRKA
jgi:DNA-binding response OmpR family regulator